MNSIRATTSTTHINSNKSDVTIDQLRPLIAKLVNQMELNNEFDIDVYNEIINLNINQNIFFKMLNNLDLFMELDDTKDEVNFPFEDWLSQLLLIDENYNN